MSNHPFSMLERAAQDTQGWLHEISREMNHPSLKVAYHALRGVLGALRDRLPIEEVHHLAAQLPALVRALYFDGYDPTGNPEKLDPAASSAPSATASRSRRSTTSPPSSPSSSAASTSRATTPPASPRSSTARRSSPASPRRSPTSAARTPKRPLAPSSACSTPTSATA